MISAPEWVRRAATRPSPGELMSGMASPQAKLEFQMGGLVPHPSPHDPQAAMNAYLKAFPLLKYGKSAEQLEKSAEQLEWPKGDPGGGENNYDELKKRAQSHHVLGDFVAHSELAKNCGCADCTRKRRLLKEEELRRQNLARFWSQRTTFSFEQWRDAVEICPDDSEMLPLVARIAQATGVSPASVVRTVRELEKMREGDKEEERRKKNEGNEQRGDT